MQNQTPKNHPTKETSAKKDFNSLLAGITNKAAFSPKLGPKNSSSTGAGLVGLVGFSALFVLATLFFITENYFVSMFIVSIALMTYVAGLGIGQIFISCFAVFFSSRHLKSKANDILEVLPNLNRALHLRRDAKGELFASNLKEGSVITLPDNQLARDLKQLIEEDKGEDYASYISHSYFSECHELYDYANENLDFVANSMPLFGLIGTILGLISMFDSLGSNVTVEALAPQLALALKTTLYGAIFSSIYKIIASRFDQRIKSLEYDYETLTFALTVLFANKNQIEIKK